MQNTYTIIAFESGFGNVFTAKFENKYLGPCYLRLLNLQKAIGEFRSVNAYVSEKFNLSMLAISITITQLLRRFFYSVSNACNCNKFICRLIV